MVGTVLWIAFLMWLIIDVGYCRILPWCNKHVFSRIWSEERPVVAREAIDRIKELCIDGDIPEETAVLMAAQEQNLTEQEMLVAFSAKDAKELVAILTNKKSGFANLLLKKLTHIDRVGMRR